jgi:hypothetical protein
MSVFQGTVQLRHGSRAEWASANPILLKGEAGIETDTGRAKYGDGGTPWSGLPYSQQNSGNIDGGSAGSLFGGTAAFDGGSA